MNQQSTHMPSAAQMQIQTRIAQRVGQLECDLIAVTVELEAAQARVKRLESVLMTSSAADPAAADATAAASPRADT
jgi:hypothetical protein